MWRATSGWVLPLVVACVPAQEPLGAPAAEMPAPAQDRRIGPPEAGQRCERIVSIEVRKSLRVLRARCAGGALVTMTAAVGREPRGDKLRAGDLRTPEGRYRITAVAKPSRFHAFVPIDYPSVDDAERALREGRITRVDHLRIVDAHRRGEEPPGDTPLGGAIGFHGEGERWAGDSLHLDWTLGCIAVSDPDLDYLIARMEPGVSVVILP